MPASARLLPTRSLPPYGYVPGSGHPHPVTDVRGHMHGRVHPAAIAADALARLPAAGAGRRRALAALLATCPEWLYALDLFNEGFYWEAHEAWERFWHALGRTTPDARFTQGLILLAAACVKVREGRGEGVRRHARRARELLGEPSAAHAGDTAPEEHGTLGLDPDGISQVLAELDRYRPECWHTAHAPAVRVVAAALRLAGDGRPRP